MLPVVTRTIADHKTREESVRKDKDKGGCLAFASPLHLLSLSFVPKQLELNHNHLRCLNGQIDIHEV